MNGSLTLAVHREIRNKLQLVVRMSIERGHVLFVDVVKFSNSNGINKRWKFAWRAWI